MASLGAAGIVLLGGFVNLSISRVRAIGTLVGLLGFCALCGAVSLLSETTAGMLFGAFGLAVFVVLGLLPHLEFATGRGPALRVDSRGRQIARWVPLEIPWSEVVQVRTYRRIHTVIHTSDRFAAGYRASRPFPQRVTEAIPSMFLGGGFSIPATIAANPDALTIWLSYELAQRTS